MYDAWREREACRWHYIASILTAPRLGAELGVKEGRFSTYLLEQFPGLHIVAVDLFSVREAVDRAGFETYEDWNWADIRKEFDHNTRKVRDRISLRVEDTVQAAESVEDASLDFVFIDAEHTYEGVSGDIRAWAPKVRPGGIIAGHDYQESRWPGVARAVREFTSKPNLSPHDLVWWVRA